MIFYQSKWKINSLRVLKVSTLILRGGERAVFNKGVSAHMSDDNARCEHSRGQAGVKKVVAHASDSFSITWRRARGGLIPTPICARGGTLSSLQPAIHLTFN